ncbi:ABC transporter [Bifidobacterium sp. DSM 109957]|uniref:ABC transporter n=2 Tax=Bifidobacterium oedipodis TaxID=2675322 RepID=A0A7Y0HT30_9BIFI|nr:ATP-binding cassette domain-containing protein [Bifidobacterium sp. DSM 109957]NMM93214.1 ABC transporter [Bifidobacterium sp. DSM 109957]
MQLQIRDLCFGYKNRPIFDHTQASFDEGCLHVVMGPSGSGKTSLLGLLDGTLQPQSGSVLIDGKGINSKDITADASDGNAWHRPTFSRIWQDYRLIPYLNVEDNVLLPLEVRRKQAADSDARTAMLDLLDMVGLAGRENEMVADLSGGESQRVAIARALITNPDILLADEPTGALDEDNTRLIANILATIAHERNAMVIVATHDQLVANTADRVLRVHNLKLVES